MPELTQLVNQESQIEELAHFKADEEGNILLAKLDLKKVKAAGAFLDGCKIVLNSQEGRVVHVRQGFRFNLGI